MIITMLIKTPLILALTLHTAAEPAALSVVKILVS